MKVVLVLVSTLNGRITRGDDPEVRHWSSSSDQEYYRGVWNTSPLIVMGSNTFRLNKIRPSEKRLVVVLASNPSEFEQYRIDGRIEFSDLAPKQLVSEFSGRDYELMTVVGGAKVAASFLVEGLVDELWLTIEPRIFGTGAGLVAEGNFEIELELKELEKVNNAGTLITKYKIIKNPDPPGSGLT